MPIVASKLNEGTRTITVAYRGDSLDVSYRPGKVNRKFTTWLSEHGNDEESVYEMLEILVASWDLLDDEGNQIPATASVLSEYDFPIAFLAAVVEAILTDAIPNGTQKQS